MLLNYLAAIHLGIFPFFFHAGHGKYHCRNKSKASTAGGWASRGAWELPLVVGNQDLFCWFDFPYLDVEPLQKRPTNSAEIHEIKLSPIQSLHALRHGKQQSPKRVTPWISGIASHGWLLGSIWSKLFFHLNLTVWMIGAWCILKLLLW